MAKKKTSTPVTVPAVSSPPSNSSTTKSQPISFKPGKAGKSKLAEVSPKASTKTAQNATPNPPKVLSSSTKNVAKIVPTATKKVVKSPDKPALEKPVLVENPGPSNLAANSPTLSTSPQKIKLIEYNISIVSDSNSDCDMFQLAAATPISISPAVERRFYESQLLLYVLERVRGDHTKRQNYHGELDQDATELRRSFVDKLAYICDFKKGGSTVTALTLQKTHQGVTFWLAANETVKPKVLTFLQEILILLKNADVKASREATEMQLLARIVSFNEERLNYYWSALSGHLERCIKQLGSLGASTNGTPSHGEVKTLTDLLCGLPKLAHYRKDLVTRCFAARKTQAFNTLAQLSGNGRPNSKFYSDIRHLLGRLGEHLKAAKTMVSAALMFPAILDVVEIRSRASPPSRCFFQSPDEIKLEGLSERIFNKQEDIKHYQEALHELERKSSGSLLDHMRDECRFKSRIHAELLLVDLAYWQQFEFVDDDAYIGCSKPACFNCFQYVLAHPGNFSLPACHNKLYLAWRSPDIPPQHVSSTDASKIREAIVNKINSSIRAELRRQIDGRCPRRSRQFDSVTGLSSSQESAERPLLPVLKAVSECASSSQDDAIFENPQVGLVTAKPKAEAEDDSDNDLSWYKSRIQRSVLLSSASMKHSGSGSSDLTDP